MSIPKPVFIILVCGVIEFGTIWFFNMTRSFCVVVFVRCSNLHTLRSEIADILHQEPYIHIHYAKSIHDIGVEFCKVYPVYHQSIEVRIINGFWTIPLILSCVILENIEFVRSVLFMVVGGLVSP